MPGGIEAIVSVEQFERVGEQIGRRKERRPFRSKVSYALSGRLHDEEGRPYVGVSGTARDGSKRCYYKYLETGVSWRRDEVEEAMAKAVSVMLSASDDVVEQIARAAADEADEHNRNELDRIESCKARLAEIGREESRLVDAMAQGIPASVVGPKLEALASERTDLEAEVASASQIGGDSMYEIALFVLEDIRSGAASPAMAAAFVSEMMIDREGHTLVAFALKTIRTPLTEVKGVLMSHKWLGH